MPRPPLQQPSPSSNGCAGIHASPHVWRIPEDTEEAVLSSHRWAELLIEGAVRKTAEHAVWSQASFHALEPSLWPPWGRWPTAGPSILRSSARVPTVPSPPEAQCLGIGPRSSRCKRNGALKAREFNRGWLGQRWPPSLPATTGRTQHRAASRAQGEYARSPLRPSRAPTRTGMAAHGPGPGCALVEARCRPPS